MKLISAGAYALLFSVAFLGANTGSASAMPIGPVAATAAPNNLIEVACKYGSGKCPDVGSHFGSVVLKKNGPQDPTVDPDCDQYGSCLGKNMHSGDDNGGQAAAAKKNPTKPKPGLTTVSGIKGESMDDKHKDQIEITSFNKPAPPPVKPIVVAPKPVMAPTALKH
jgi:hypothetical protein